MRRTKAKGKVVVAMSGGVDSSVAAALLVQAGYEVIGVTMRLSEEVRGGDRTAEDARRVADILRIPHHVVDFRALFRRRVIDDFIASYAAGKTPNPCVSCNRYLKFSAMWEKARALDSDFLATGHYARVLWHSGLGRYQLLKGRDERKDQSYMLYTIEPALLPHLLLPLGGFTKLTIRDMAAEFDLPVAEKAESQEICFIPDDDYGRFLREHCADCLKPGEIVDGVGRVLGRHSGVPLYTVGQRRGLGIAAPEPLYVTGLDMVKNQVIVGKAEEVFADTLIAQDVNWLTDEGGKEPRRITAKIRYGHSGAWATVAPLDAARVEVRFDTLQRAITPGQSVVFYDGDEVLGGGVIAGRGRVSQTHPMGVDEDGEKSRQGREQGK